MQFRLRAEYDVPRAGTYLALDAIITATTFVTDEELEASALGLEAHKKFILESLCRVLGKEIGKTITVVPRTEDGVEWTFEVTDG